MEMENKSLKNRLYLSLIQKTPKPSYLLEQNSSSPAKPLKPKVLQENTFHVHRSPQTYFNQGKFSISMKNKESGKVVKPKEVEVEKLSKEAKVIMEEGKGKFKSNLKPKDIFSFYDSFPEMLEDFFYLNRIDHPYDYQIVSYAKRNPNEYMTISSQGVTLYHQKQAEFLTREEWLEDEKIYHKLQKIDFFSQYKLSKNFGIWKNRMKRHYMKEMSNILDEKLFLAFLHPRKCLLDIRLASLRLKQSLNMMPSNLIEPIKWKELIDTSEKFQSKDLLNKIGEIEKKVVSSLQLAIEEEINNFKISNNIKIDGLNSKQGNKEGYVYSQQAILRKQYKRIIKLIRLGQSILLESKIELFQRFLEEISEKMKEVTEDTLKEDWLVVIFTAFPSLALQNQIQWNPSQKQFVSTFRTIINKTVQIICDKHEKILNHPVFEKYKTTEEQGINKEDKHNSLKILIEDSPSYCDLMLKIQEYLEKEYQHVVKEEKSLMKFLRIFSKHRNLEKMEDILQYNTALELSQFVREWKEDHEEMQHLPDKCVGILKFDFSILRKQMIHIPGQSLSNLFTLLPSHLNDKCHFTSKKTKKLLQSINIIPNDQTFVDFTKAVKIAVDSLDEIIDEGKEIKQLLILLEDNRRPNLQIHRSNIKEVASVITQLKGKVDEANAKYDHRLSKFKKDIEVTINRIKNNAKELSSKFEAINFDNSDSEINEILMKITSVLPQIIQMESEMTKIQTIEHELTLNETNFEEARKLHRNAQLINELWTCKKQWKELMTIIKIQHYSKIDCEDLTQKWELFTNRSNNLKQSLPDSTVLNKLTEEINAFENLMDLVRALQSKSINSKSWKQISEYLAYEIDKTQDGDPKSYPFYDHTSSEYTMDWLTENNICLYKQKIKFIVKKSEKQTQLGNVLAILKTYINCLTLQFVTKKRDIVLLTDNSTVFNQLNSHLSQLNQILDQDYSESIKKEAKVLVKHYEYVSEVLGAYWEFGKFWSRYEGLFESTRTFSKLLNKESKDFINWELGWKKITKNITLENWSKKIVEETTGLHPSRTTMKQVMKINQMLDQIKRGVQEFLDKKRSSFWRYFFFPDEQLLDLLIKTDIQQLQEIVPLFYEEIQEINIDRQRDLLINVKSKDGEELKIGKLVTSKLLSEPQQILKACEEQWKKTLISTIKKVFNDFVSPMEEEISRVKIITQNVTQVVLGVDHIIWVRLAEETYLCDEPVGTLNDWIQIQEYQVRQIFSLLDQFKTNVEKKKIYQLLTQSLFFRQKTEYFLKNKINSLSSYEWERTLKFCDGRGNLHEKLYMKQLSAIVYYGGQFMGCRDLNFITPETQRVYLNLISAINQKDIIMLEGNENRINTLAQLSYLVAQPLHQFDFCSNINERSLDKLFCGSCINGGWICFNLPSQFETISIIASHISQLRKSLFEGNYSTQFGKYTIQINQTSPPNFFFNMPVIRERKEELFRKMHQWRIISFLKPDLKKIMEVRAECYEQNKEVGAVISDVVEYCHKMFSNDLVNLFSVDFAKTLFKKFLTTRAGKQKKMITTMGKIVKELLTPYLNTQNKNLLTHFFDSYEEENFNRKNKILNKKVSSILPHPLDQFISSLSENVKLNLNYKHATTLYDLVADNENTQKKFIVTGSSLIGKSYLIDFVCQAYNYLNQSEEPALITKIYHQAYKKEEVLKILAKSLCPSNRKNWIVFDGPINDFYLQTFCEESEKLVIEGLGILNLKSCQNQKFFLETSDISAVPPTIIFSHQIVHIHDTDAPSLIEVIIRKNIQEPLYKVYEETIKHGKQEEGKTELKVMKVSCKKSHLSEQTINYLIDQLIAAIRKITYEGKLKIKCIQMLYSVTELQIAYRCSNLVKSVLKMNWQTIKENEKNLRKNIDKFIFWTIVWTLTGFTAPEDYLKLEKQIIQILKITYVFSQGISKHVIYPGAGLEIHPIRSIRAQSALPNIPSCGVPTNVLMCSNCLQQNTQTVKNKFYEQIYLDQPFLVRINTDQSALFSYVSLLNSYVDSSMMIYGQPGTGKKSLLDLYMKNNQQKEEVYSIRLKRHDNYYLSQQIFKPFFKFNGLEKNLYKFSDNYRKLHILIEDVHLTTKNEPSIQYLRMIINEGGAFAEDGNWASFFRSALTMILNQIDFFNLERVSFNRVLSKVGLMQTSLNEKEKLVSIFSPITQTWGNSIWDSNECEELRVFTSQNGDNIIDASVNVYLEIEEYLNNLPSQTNVDCLKKIMMKPRISDLCLLITNICQLDDPEKNSIKDYASLWAHEVLRVFGDKNNDKGWMDMLGKQIKKQLLLKFKENFTLPHNFIYTDLNKESYERCDNYEDLFQDIHTILNDAGYTLPFNLLFDQLINEMLKIYRVIGMSSGHILMVTPETNYVKHLTKIATFIKEVTMYEMGNRMIHPQNHMIPTVINEVPTILSFVLDEIPEQILFQISCLLNRNYETLELGGQTLQKIKGYFFSIAQQSYKENNKSNDSSNRKVAVGGEIVENAWTISMKKKIQEKLDLLISESFCQNMHIVISAKETSSSLKILLKNYSSILKHMHISYSSIKEASVENATKTILGVDENMQVNEMQEKVCKNCSLLYKNASAHDLDLYNYYEILGRSIEKVNKLRQKLGSKIAEYERCLEFRNKIEGKIEEGKQKQEVLQLEIDVVVKKINSLKDKNEQNNAENQSATKELKIERERLEQVCRQLRNTQTLHEGLLKQIPARSKKQLLIEQLKKKRNELPSQVVLVEFLLIQNREMTEKEEYLRKIKEWSQIIGYENKINSEDQVLELFSRILGKEYVYIQKWRQYSKFLQIMAITFCYNYLQIMNVTSDNYEVIKVNDPNQILLSMLSELDENGSYGNCKFLKKFNKNEDWEKKDHRQRDKNVQTKKHLFNQIEKELYKYRFGIVMMEEFGELKVLESDIEKLLKSLSQKKQIESNRIVLLSKEAKMQIKIDFEQIKNRLVKKSLQLELGQNSLLEKKSLEMKLLQQKNKLEKKKQLLIECCIDDEMEIPRLLEKAEKINQSIHEVSEQIKKSTQMIEGERFKIRDEYIIDWILSFIDNQKISLPLISTIHELIQKELIIINNQIPEEQNKINNLEQVPPHLLTLWKKYIDVNFLSSDSPFLDYINHALPIQSPPVIVVEDYPENLNYIMNQLSMVKYHYKTYDCLASPQSFLGNSNLDSSAYEGERRVYVLYNYFGDKATHKSALMEVLNKHKETEKMVFVVLADSFSSLKNDDSLKKYVNIVCKPLSSLILKPSFENDGKSNKVLQIPLKSSNFANFAKSSSVIESENESTTKKQCSEEGQKQFKKIIQKFMNFYKAWMVEQRIQENIQENEYKKEIEICLKKQYLMENISFLQNTCDIIELMKDFLFEGEDKWTQVAALYTEPLSTESEEKIQKLQDYLQTKKLKNQNKSSKKPSIPKFLQKENVEASLIQQIIKSLPFAFNPTEYAQTNEPFLCWLINEAFEFNSEKHLLKQYLLNLAKIIEGSKPDPYDNRTMLPTEEYLEKLCQNYEIIKKGLEFHGIIQSHDSSILSYKNLGSSNQIGSNIMTIGVSAFNSKRLKKITEKQLIMLTIKACKKLKIPFDKIKTIWKVYHQSVTFEEPIMNGELCFNISGKLLKGESLVDPFEKCQTIKIIYCPYSPAVVQNNQMPVQKPGTQKKQSKKAKQEMTKVVRSSVVNSNQLQVGITSSRNEVIGNVVMSIKGSTVELYQKLEKPTIRLF